MAHNTTIVNDNVILIEPNIMNGNENQTNTVPQYQDMYIFAELIAKRKGRTVIINNNVSGEFSSDYSTINFMGNNQDDSAENPNFLNYTTNYYDGSVGNKTQYEGFGITSINMQINSSYIPRVKIRFVDIRGLAFFNQDDSPYRMLFDFPPPIFQLTVKGYYGKPLSYKLHLVKYTSEFSSKDGNFTIDAEFVGLTFAPLTDILFKYILNTPLIQLGGDMSSDTGEPPTCTHELILKLKSIYSQIGDYVKTADESTELRRIENDLNKISLVDEQINNVYENEILTNVGNPYLARRTPRKPSNLVELRIEGEGKNDYLAQIRNIREFNSEIVKQQSSKNPEFKEERIYIVYQVSSNLDENIEIPPYPQPIDFAKNPLPDYFSGEGQNRAPYYIALNKFKERLLGEDLLSINISDSDINAPESIIVNSNLKDDNDSRSKYYAMEITDFYYKLYYEKGSLSKRKEKLIDDITEKINALVIGKLGMLPSVYNVMEIILNDVDKFFEILKNVSLAAHEKHNERESKDIIINDSTYGEKTNITTVYPFPLIIEEDGSKNQKRVAPIELSEKIEFPELTLISDFIDTFLTQNKWEEQYNMRDQQNDDGEIYWIPIVPLDSILGGASPTSPYLGLSDNVRDNVLRIILMRYYIFSQGALPYDVYPDLSTSSGRRKIGDLSTSYVKLYGATEAINLNEVLLSTQSKKTLDIINEMSKRYSNNINNFYNDIQNLTGVYQTNGADVTGNLYNFPENQPISFPLTPSDANSARVYTDKSRSEFVGLNFTTERIEINNDNDTTDRLNEFIKNNSDIGGSKRALRKKTYSFTSDNLLYLPDEYDDDDFFGGRNETKGTNSINLDEGGKTGLYTRFLNQYAYIDYIGFINSSYGSRGFDEYGDDIQTKFPSGNGSIINGVDIGLYTAYNEGHASFGSQKRTGGSQKNYNMGNNITDVWAHTLGANNNDEKLYPYLTNDDNLSSVLFLSNFGNTVSPFAQYPNNLRTNFFMVPSVIETPMFLGAYIGALLFAIEEGWEEDILNFFTGTTVSQNIILPNKGFYVLADLHDVKEYLAEKDKQAFISEYNRFMLNYDTFKREFKQIYNAVNDFENRSKIDRYKYFLDPNVDTDRRITENSPADKGQFKTLIEKLIFRKKVIIHTEITFDRVSLTDSTLGYKSLSQIINDETYGERYYKPLTDSFFETLFGKLNVLIGDTKDVLRDEHIENEKIRGDKHIINQLYYSFKNINDKWLSGTGESKKNYPLIAGNNTKLIDRFKFVDRAMNPIGETIINAEMLIDLVDNDNASVFTVISSLLSANGFIFFPLQNFLSFDDDDSWEDSFKIHSGSIQNEADTYFVAMYIGGTSSYPSTKTNGFEEDGIISFAETLPNDFNNNVGDSNRYTENQNQEDSAENFPWRQVRAFRVRFGEQNQSMFEDIKIDSKEYNDTNESIQILSRLAGDNKKSQPTPIGQNLYNVYENRSYKASVTGFGNAMIQPTQYFQLENIPMFNGAYIILDVEHNITPNKMTTTFSGTKILKYPVPRVTDAMTLRGYSDVGSGEAVRRALEIEQIKVVPQATMMSQERLDYLDCVYGIDVSHWNGNIDWKQMKKNTVPVDYAIMKITQGINLDSFQYSRYDFTKNLTDAKANGIKIGVYHFAVFGRTANPYNDANADADHFLDNVARMPSPPDLPVALDIEMDCFTQVSTYNWSNRDQDVKTYIERWIQRVSDAGYEVMIYTAPQYLENVNTDYLSNYPLWYGRPTNVNGSMNPEIWEPTTPVSGWNDWDIWQFSFQGNIMGGNGNIDLNAMRKSFFNKY